MRFTILLAIFCILAAPITTMAETTPATEIGLRGGFDAGWSSLDENYKAGELYFFRELPWGAQLIKNTTLSTRFDLGATYLEGGDDEGAMLAAGVDLVLGSPDGSLQLEAGFRPTWMFGHEYGDDDFGGVNRLALKAAPAENCSDDGRVDALAHRADRVHRSRRSLAEYIHAVTEGRELIERFVDGRQQRGPLAI